MRRSLPTGVLDGDLELENDLMRGLHDFIPMRCFMTLFPSVETM